MRRITMWFLSTVAAVVLLFSYRTSTMGAGAPAVRSSPAAPASDTTASAAAGDSGTTVVNGSVAQTRWGPVQVQVHIAGGRITDVKALRVPSGNRRDQEINSYAVPQLRAEVLAAQRVDVDTISGATVTSDGYLESLQAALDAAHFNG